MSLIMAARAGTKRPRSQLRVCCQRAMPFVLRRSNDHQLSSRWYYNNSLRDDDRSKSTNTRCSIQQHRMMHWSNHHRHLSHEASATNNRESTIRSRQNKQRHYPNNPTNNRKQRGGLRSKKKATASTLSPRQIQQLLSSRLSFFFSDTNLRHDAYSRSLMIEQQYLPMDVLMTYNSIKRISDDPDDVLNAIEESGRNNNNNNNNNNSGGVLLPLETKRQSNGDILIGRTIPFEYEESMRTSLTRIMTVRGWPVEINTRWVEEQLKTLLSEGAAAAATTQSHDRKNDATTTTISTTKPIVYWGKNVAGGIITLEFDTDASADAAWETLHSMTQSHELSDGETPNPAELICEFESERRCQLMVGDLSLVMERMGVDEVVVVEEKTQLSDETSEDETTHMKTDSTKIDTVEGTDVEQNVKEQPTKPIVAKWWDNKSYAPSLYQCIKTMDELYTHHRTLPPPPRGWLHESRFNKRFSRVHANLTADQFESRQELCADVSSIVGCVHNSIGRGVIRALGARDAYAMSDFLNRAMLILSESPPRSRSRKSMTHPLHKLNDGSKDKRDSAQVGMITDVSPYEACLDALKILRSLNLDVHPHHYSYAIRSACHEFRWEEAARIFLGQVDGVDSIVDGGGAMHDATGGFAPLDSTLGWDQPLEVGLYAVAIDALKKVQSGADGVVGDGESSPSSQVFHTAMKMSMIAPSRQENYILAAGSALGRAGLWSDCLDFATDQNNISMYGPSIPGAAMLSCIESQRSEEAVELYDYFFKSGNQNTASEWQWSGGNLSAAKPLFDNLLLRAMGGSLSGGFSAAAMKAFCDMVDNDIPISADAIVGLMQSIEHDGDWQSAIHLFKEFLFDTYYNVTESKWRLVHERPSMSGIDDIKALTQGELEDLTAKLLASTMRVCNKEGFYSLSILLSSITHSLADDSFCREMLFPNDASAMKVIESQKLLSSKPVRDAYSHSLSKVGLQRIGGSIVGDMEGVNTRGKINYFPSSGEAMLNAFFTSNQVLVALEDVRQSKEPLSNDDKILITRGLASAMNFYLDAHHPASAMQLFRHASEILKVRHNRSPDKNAMQLFRHASELLKVRHNRSQDKNAASFTSTTFISTLFEDDRSNPTAASMFQTNDAFDYETLKISDSLLAAVMKSYTALREPDKALKVLENVHGNLENATWDIIHSFNNALEVLLEHNVDEFMNYFENPSNRGLVMPSTYLALGRKYVRDEAWPELGELYNEARARGCVSEELGLLAMQAVCEAELNDGKILVLRRIADDISNLVGMKSKDWYSSQYWHIKRHTGFHYARMLMNWNEPATSQKEELIFAINEMRQCRQQGFLSKNAPLFCIVKQGELYESDKGYKGTRLSESQRRAAINIIFEACSEAQRSGLIGRPAFTAEVVRSLVALKGDKQCIEFVKTLVVDGRKCRHRVAMEYAIKAAFVASDNESFTMLMNVFENSGFNPQAIDLTS